MNWLKEIEDATTPVCVLVVVNEYLDAATDDFRRRVPPGMLPPPLKSLDELQAWQAKLTGAVTDNPMKAPPSLLDLSYVFLRAAAHALELQEPAAAANHALDQAVKG